MEIACKNNKLKKTLNSEKLLKKKYGKDNGQAIMNRLLFMREAQNLSQVPIDKPLRRHQLKGRRKGQFAVDLKGLKRLIFEPNHNPIPRKEDGGIDLERVTAITILSVEDYH